MLKSAYKHVAVAVNWLNLYAMVSLQCKNFIEEEENFQTQMFDFDVVLELLLCMNKLKQED